MATFAPLVRRPVAAGAATTATPPTNVARAPSLGFGRYVDRFSEVFYDLSYKRRGGSASTVLRVRYQDGTVIEIDINSFETGPTNSDEFFNSIHNAYVGAGGRIFPLHLTERTVPNLWAARHDAILEIERNFQDFVGVALPGSMLAITLPAMPAGEPVGMGGGGPRRTIVRRIPVKPGGGLPPASETPPGSQGGTAQPGEPAPAAEPAQAGEPSSGGGQAPETEAQQAETPSTMKSPPFALRSGAVVKVVEQVDDIVILEARVGGRVIQIAANVAKEGTTLYLRKAHIEGAAPGQIGVKGLFDMARDLGKANNVTDVVIQGGRRTTGIGKILGSIPRPIRVKVKGSE